MTEEESFEWLRQASRDGDECARICLDRVREGDMDARAALAAYQMFGDDDG